jgi:S-(hydroxymethyl)glutathione dehydrogenase / alcohol dehydrogenase
MKALVYHGPIDVRVDDKPKPKIQNPEDIVLKITKSAICGSDLHLFHGNFKSMEPGQTLGHEFAGVVEQAGDKVTEVKEGDRVVIPFNIIEIWLNYTYFSWLRFIFSCKSIIP